MDINNNLDYTNMNENENMNNNEENMYNINRFDDRRYDFDNRFDNRYDNRYDNRFNNRFDNRYDRRYDRYYRYPYCDRNGRCDNNLWWLFWPFFFF